MSGSVRKRQSSGTTRKPNRSHREAPRKATRSQTFQHMLPFWNDLPCVMPMPMPCVPKMLPACLDLLASPCLACLPACSPCWWLHRLRLPPYYLQTAPILRRWPFGTVFRIKIKPGKRNELRTVAAQWRVETSSHPCAQKKIGASAIFLIIILRRE